jgi:2-polyprenyl-3-methyl-5-hydroxy-6-metoxy-1,4-benzoquinol methylase
MYIDPQPATEELAAYYPEDYEAHVGTRRQQLGWLHRTVYLYGIQKRHRAIMRYIPPGRLLDIGCATGAFLDNMRERGWEVAGIEPSVRAATYAREELGLDVQNTALETAQLESESFDLVTMWNVLEHLSDPQRALHRIRETLRVGGLLVFAIPNVESYAVRLFGKYWAGYDIPRHLFVFPRATLERMVQVAGFEVLECRCIYGTYDAFAYSARFVMHERITSEKLRSAVTRIILSLPARVLMMPLTRGVDLLNRGTVMTWFCRKVERV